MQNEQTLIDLGFKKIPSGEYLFRGKNQKFTAHVVTYNGPVYVKLFMVHPDIDNRPKSDRKGHHYRTYVKDCCSQGSVKRAIERYDMPEHSIQRLMTGIAILHETNSHL